MNSRETRELTQILNTLKQVQWKKAMFVRALDSTIPDQAEVCPICEGLAYRHHDALCPYNNAMERLERLIS